MHERWMKAVVHLECAADSVDWYEWARVKEVAIGSGIDFKFGDVSRNVRQHGSALFLEDEGRRYLLTARHVVFDNLSAERNRKKFRAWSEKLSPDIQASTNEIDDQQLADTIFNMIFRVPSLDEYEQGAGLRDQPFLMNLGAGASSSRPYTFSSPEIDLAIISLDRRDREFSDNLLMQGYEPVNFEDIADGPSGVGEELFSIGFPSATSLVGQVKEIRDATWASAFVSSPTISFGRVSMLHRTLDFFWADLRAYPGNSGGPVIANDRLVGIVSAQATLPTDDLPEVRTRIPFARVIKSAHAKDLLGIQKKKDAIWS